MADNKLGAITGLASRAVMTPVGGAARVVGFARGTSKAVGGLLHRRGAAPEESQEAEPAPTDLAAGDEASAAGDDQAEASVEEAREVPAETAEAPSDGSSDGSSEAEPAQPELLPYPQLQEPVPIVEQVLEQEAKEGAEIGHVGHATEPKATTRDEEHGDAALQRAELDEIAEEAAEAFPGGDVDLETPVGTTGADVGHNPDTAEADLQQPGTPPVMDPGTVHTVASESEVLRQAADPARGD